MSTLFHEMSVRVLSILNGLSANGTPSLCSFFSGRAKERSSQNVVVIYLVKSWWSQTNKVGKWVLNFGLNILKVYPFCFYQIMADNSSERKKDSTPEGVVFDKEFSANNRVIVP